MGAFNNSETAYAFVTAIFFFLLLQTIPHVYSNYVGHQFLTIVRENDLYRNLFLLLAIWFIINYTEEGVMPEEIEHNMWEKIVLTISLFLFILLFSRQEAVYNAVEIFLLFVMYIIYQVKLDNDNVHDPALEYASYALLGLTVVIIFIGYYSYMMLKMRQKGNRFSFLKFVFGKREVEYSTKGKSYSTMH